MKLVSQDERNGIDEVLRRVEWLRTVNYKTFGKDLVYPADFMKQIDKLKELKARWKKNRQERQPEMISVEEVFVFTTSAEFLVNKFHEINGTEAPDVSFFSQPCI